MSKIPSRAAQVGHCALREFVDLSRPRRPILRRILRFILNRIIWAFCAFCGSIVFGISLALVSLEMAFMIWNRTD